MKITDRIYKTSGVEYGTNSNTFAVDTDAGIVLLDLGYETKQWESVQSVLKFWGFEGKKAAASFLTHGHYDHAGNTYRANEAGIPVYAADPDAYKVANGYPEMEVLFGRPWICGKIDHLLEDGQEFVFGDVKVTAYAAPGHSMGSFAFVIEADGHRALCTGDMFYIRPLPPEDAVDLELAYMGGEDFSMSDFAATLEKMSELHCDILLPGHYYVYYGDVDALCRRAASMVKSMMEGKEND